MGHAPSTDTMLSVHCSAKVNLYLDVIRKRDNGYHEIETIYQPISLWDELTFEARAGGFELAGDDPSIPWDETNLCYQAARALFDKTGFKGGVGIRVRKRIPPGSGLGGGSSNAAATLIGLNDLFKFGLSMEELMELGAGIGSDVPFFVMGRPAIGRGRGEILELVEGLRWGWIIVAKPDVSVSSVWAYQNIKLMLTKNRDATKIKRLLEGLKSLQDARLDTHNSFESTVVESFPEVGKLLTLLRDREAAICSLSGSGSASFAVFSEENKAIEVKNYLNDEGFFARIVRPVSQAMKLLL